MSAKRTDQRPEAATSTRTKRSAVSPRSFLVLGAGNMGAALAQSFDGAGFFQSWPLLIRDPDQAKAQALADTTGGKVIEDISQAVRSAMFVMLAVKPQVMEECVREIAPHLKPDTVLISIAAGIEIAQIQSWTCPEQPVCRVMPNLPAVVGAGVFAISLNQVESRQADTLLTLFSACGTALVVDERQMDIVTGLSGSGPGYIMLIIEALADAGVRGGLPRSDALRLAAATVAGSGKLVLESGIHPAEWKDRVCSPGGTTIEGIASLEEDGVRAALIRAVGCSAARSAQLRQKDQTRG